MRRPGRLRGPFLPPFVVGGDITHERGHGLADGLIGGPPEQLLSNAPSSMRVAHVTPLVQRVEQFLDLRADDLRTG
ncbi:hypothetical protein [Streptomyces sp. NBC_01320]|uniref:hypothetical protein n=1 Tax=Streptomyces sp. NBC_01320 TaxID=2903824 RepID=UPI002E13B2F1|nr:hypothetical protein OG395_18025 [Streptomyces sp. NBC_01320]